MTTTVDLAEKPGAVWPQRRNKAVLDAMAGESGLALGELSKRSGLPVDEVARVLLDLDRLERRGRLPARASLGRRNWSPGTLPPGAVVEGRTPAQWLLYDREARDQAERPAWRPGGFFVGWRQANR